jgi:hypothetical protein
LTTVAAPLLVLLGFSGAARAQTPTVSEVQARPHLLTDYGEAWWSPAESRNGLEGDVRFNYPHSNGSWLIEPFAFGGLGWTHFHVNGLQASTASSRSSDDVLTVPVGGGLTVGYDHILSEGRFTYRQTFNEALVPGGNGTLKNWTAGAAVGYEF